MKPTLNSRPTINQKTTIFVDGQCIVCDFEISHYKRLAPELFEIIDITSKDFVAQRFKLNPADVNKKMHVFSREGEILTGVDAFACIWSQLKGYRILAKIIKWPGIYSVAKLGYWLFATIRPYLPKKRPSNA
jgi:predicted DCC family thiol-disulfide oxidoreductase YuxK